MLILVVFLERCQLKQLQVEKVPGQLMQLVVSMVLLTQLGQLDVGRVWSQLKQHSGLVVR